MVTKRTGRPRGRPRNPPPSKPPQPRGRPKFSSIRDDPDRFEIALLDAMLALRWGSERTCATAIVTTMLAAEVDSPRVRADGYVVTSWQWIGGRAATIEGRVSTLRKERHAYQSKTDLHWRTAMSAAYRVAMTSPEKAQAEHLTLRLARIAGEEGELPRLRRMIDARFFGYFSLQAKSLERV